MSELETIQYGCEALLNVQSDAHYSCNGDVLSIGTVSDNYWQGHCAHHDATTHFKLKNHSDVKEFRLAQVGFDDHFLVKVNGHTVYVGPNGGDRLELTQQKSGFGNRMVVSTGGSLNPCELGNNWMQNLNIDLKPYLVNGENTIQTRTIVSGTGESWMKIAIK